ncbi:MAG: hypothetical protein ACRBBP_05305 [Bdellovibrionales bacterium]
MKLLKGFFLCGLMFFTYLGFSEEDVKSIEEYNEKLPVWGVSWRPGSRAVSGLYYPSFYTGFAPRQQTPNRVHIRLSRGNQTRASVILDEGTVLDYTYDLKTRSELYKELLSEEIINISPKNSSLSPQVKYFLSVVEQGVLNPASEFNSGSISKEALYVKNLAEMKKLNPGRIFDLSIDLSSEFLKWRNTQVGKSTVDTSSSSQAAMVLVNHMLWGRINLTRNLSSTELGILSELINGKGVFSDEGFVLKTYELFNLITDGKYEFKRLDAATSTFVDAKTCKSLHSCNLSYSEFSAIYPTGSLKASVSDGRGNRISRYATPGLHAFIDTGSRGDVDNIRKESYYGFAPKMDYEAIGNGFHNPAVRHVPGSSVREAMNLGSRHTQYWPVMRGGVSHGCSRLPLGHVWEMRHLFPVQNTLMTEVYYFGNDSRDFDVFDVDGDGSLEVMGVNYYIQYGLRGSSGLAKREGVDLNLNTNILKYYKRLYGKNDVFTESAGLLTMYNPSVSIQTVNDRWSGSRSSGKVTSRYTFEGEYPLYEQAYEKDKVQFYTSYTIRGFNDGLSGGGKESRSKRFVRLLGRVKGCAPFSNKETCGAAAYESEKAKIFKEIR